MHPALLRVTSSQSGYDPRLLKDDTLTLEMLCADLVCSEMTKSTVCRNEQTYADLVGAIHESPA